MTDEGIEQRVLAALEDNAQASYAEIASHAGVSKPTVRKYVTKLEDEGVIVGYSADIDPKKLTGTTIALVGIEAESERYVEVVRALVDIDEVEALYTSSGDHMLMAEVRASDGNALGDVISDRIHSIQGVDAAHPSFLQERLK